MNFLIFRDFSGFFWINFAIFNVKNDLKIKQKVGIILAGPRGCDVACKATWQRHAGPRGAYATRCDMLFIYIVII